MSAEIFRKTSLRENPLRWPLLHPLHFFIAFFFLFLLFFSKISFGAEPRTSRPFRIDADNILATGVIHSAFDFMGRNLVIYGIQYGEKINLEGDFDNFDSFITNVMPRFNLKQTKIDSIDVFGRGCINQFSANKSLNLTAKVSLNFQAVELKALWNVLQDFYNFKIENGEINDAETRINISELALGTYFLLLKNGETMKFLKE